MPRTRRLVNGEEKTAYHIFLNLARPGSKTTKLFLSSIPWSAIKRMISSPSSFRALPGNRIRIGTPSFLHEQIPIRQNLYPLSRVFASL